MNEFQKTLRSTAYLESDPTKPLCRHYCDAYDREAEALLDILDSASPDSFDVASEDRSALLAPIDVTTYEELSQRLEEWEDMIPAMSKLNKQGLADVCEFVNLVRDAYEHNESPVIVVSVEV